ncbi:MAG TPA: hypothetical protein VE263_19430 [Candidatus Angelobacter sp.]|nr:hypothetical protein [Candidatus Angelobacter sp.]
MRFPRTVLVYITFAACLSFSLQGGTQNPPDSSPAPAAPRPEKERITIQVTGGNNDVPVENASVYLMYVEEHKIKKDKKLELNVKTSREGIAHVPDAPAGRVRIQIIAEGWKTYGRWYDITDPNQVIKIHLERPPKWY